MDIKFVKIKWKTVLIPLFLLVFRSFFFFFILTSDQILLFSASPTTVTVFLPSG